MNNSLYSNQWYNKEQAKDFSVLPCYPLKLYTVDDRIIDGFYYNGNFYNRNDEEVTAWIEAWMIQQNGEEIHIN